MRFSIQQLFIPTSATVSEAMEAMDANAAGFVFLGGAEIPQAVVTDGDIRRAILKGTSISSKVLPVATKDFLFATTSDHPSVIAEKLKSVDFLPIIDTGAKLVSIATREENGIVPVYEPMMGSAEWVNLREAIESGWISSGGPFVREFELMLGEYLGAEERVLAVSNGTSALELCLRTLGVGQNDEVIVPDLTFVATANAVLNVGARPIPVDVHLESGLLDQSLALEAMTPRTKAVIPVHLYGRPFDVESLRKSLPNPDIFVIEDCAEAFGTSIRGKMVGTLGHAAAFSFFGNKNITTGEGGAAVFEEVSYCELARAKRGHGFSTNSRRYSITQGSNYRMTNLQASVGVAQMENLPQILGEKKRVSQAYESRLSGLEGVNLPSWHPDEDGVDWLFTVGLSRLSEQAIEELVIKATNRGFEFRREFLPLSSQSILEDSIDSSPIAKKRSESYLCLPSSPKLQDETISEITDFLLHEEKKLRFS